MAKKDLTLTFILHPWYDRNGNRVTDDGGHGLYVPVLREIRDNPGNDNGPDESPVTCGNDQEWHFIDPNTGIMDPNPIVPRNNGGNPHNDPNKPMYVTTVLECCDCPEVPQYDSESRLRPEDYRILSCSWKNVLGKWRWVCR